MSDQTPPPPGPQHSPPPPAPQYGEYAPAAPAAPASQYSYVPATPAAAEAPKSRTWDVVLTVILLVLGLVGAFLGISTGLTLPTAMDQLYSTYGLGDYVDDGSTSVPGTILWVSHLVLYLAVLAISIPLLLKRKVAFWVPLTAGVIAAIIYWATMLTVVFGDPRLVEVLSNPQSM